MVLDTSINVQIVMLQSVSGISVRHYKGRGHSTHRFLDDMRFNKDRMSRSGKRKTMEKLIK